MSQQTQAGYSRTPLSKKLGIKAGFTVGTVNAPENYAELLEASPERVFFATGRIVNADIVHIFTNSRHELFSELAKLRQVIKQDGSIWVSWYKRAAKRPTEITEDTVREAALPLGLVDVKVCAVDECWSGLKLVIRKENRT